MNVLGIETATDVCSVGIVSDERTFHRSLREDRVHSEKVLTLTDLVLKDAGLTPHDLHGIAVSSGPGSFTGLRIGVSTAKGMCYALDLPLLGVPTFDAIARAARSSGVVEGPVVVAADARQGDWYVGTYDGQGVAVWRGVETLAEVSQRLSAGQRMLTDRPEAFAGGAAIDLHPFCRGDVVAVAAAERLRSGKTDDPAKFEPADMEEFVTRKPRAQSELRQPS